MRWVIGLIIYIGLSLYVLQGLKIATKQVWWQYLYVAVAVIVLINFAYRFSFSATQGRVLDVPKSYAFGLLLAVLSFNVITILFLFFEDFVRVGTVIFQNLFGTAKGFHMPERRRFVSLIGLGLAALPFGALLYGMYKGKYNYKVLSYELSFDDLPEAFDGYKITQISDIHSGSFDNIERVSYGVDLINEQKSDVILFTGDMVNNRSEEMKPWASLFGTLEAKDGKFSILGNHDYGDYISWESSKAKLQNLQDLKDLQKQMGFQLLLNENKYLTKNGDRIALIGVENWGKGGFIKVGDLKLASKNIEEKDFKILMSHDPSHWEEIVLKSKTKYHLTLSGHTHGMQFGIEIPGLIKWSPVKWRYKYWAGIYKELGQYINVNRGFGFLGYPGRFGIWPEITVITLKKNKIT